MPDQKISDLAAATSTANADLLPTVQGGVNKKATRAIVLTGAPGEDMTMTLAAGQRLIIGNPLGAAFIIVDDTGTINVQANATAALSGNGAASTIRIAGTTIQLFGATGPFDHVWDVNAGFSKIAFKTGTDQIQITSGIVIFVQYFAAVPGNWNIAPPPDYNTAIDRLAAAVAGLLAGPIP